MIAALQGAPTVPTLKRGLPGQRGELPSSGRWGRVRRPRGCASVVRALRHCSRHSWKAPCARVSRGADSDSSPFLLLPGSLTREQCRSGQCAGTQRPAVTARPARRTHRSACCTLPADAGECASEAADPAAARPNPGGFYNLLVLVGFPGFKESEEGSGGGGWRSREPFE